MLSKKLIGTVATSSLVGMASQSSMGYADIYSILSKLKTEDPSITGEFVKYNLRIERDFAVVESVAKRMFSILKSRNKGEEIGIINVLKECSNTTIDLANNEESIEYLINKIKNPNGRLVEELRGLELINNLLNAKIIEEDKEYTSFLKSKDLLKELLSYQKREDFVKDYENYSEKMKHSEEKIEQIVEFLNSTKEILNKVKNINKVQTMREPRIRKEYKSLKIWVKDFDDTGFANIEKDLKNEIDKCYHFVKEYYSNPNGWVRYLATLGFFINKNSFPTQENMCSYSSILLKYYAFSTAPGFLAVRCFKQLSNYAFNETLKSFGVENKIGINPVNILLAPYIDKINEKFKEYLIYKFLNHDEHLNSLATTSNFDTSTIFKMENKDITSYKKEVVRQTFKATGWKPLEYGAYLISFLPKDK